MRYAMTRVGDYVDGSLPLTLQRRSARALPPFSGLHGRESTFIDLEGSNVETGTRVFAFLVLQVVPDVLDTAIVGEDKASCGCDY
jgi:hypothetical protein